MQAFKDLQIGSDTIKKLSKMGIHQPTPIQSKAIPILLEGQDLIAQAQTGTGKTFAFSLPILEKIEENADHIQALILSPTRELAIQITEEMEKIKKDNIQILAVYGGQDVERQLKKIDNANIVIATPGRLTDHLKRGSIDLTKISYLVLDEADQMLHIGFMDELNFIMKYVHSKRQTMLFSATISKEIEKLATKYTKNAQYITVEKKQGPADTVKQASIHTPDRSKQQILMGLINEYNPFMAVIFCRTKRRVTKLYEVLRSHYFSCGQLHGDLSQTKREQVMKDFRDGKFQLLVATDVAARGLDIEGITHIFNYDIPQDAESYVHRIGRTGRAGMEGHAITFYSSADRPQLDAIEKELSIKIEKIQQPKGQKQETERATNQKKTSTEKRHSSSKQKKHTEANDSSYPKKKNWRKKETERTTNKRKASTENDHSSSKQKKHMEANVSSLPRKKSGQNGREQETERTTNQKKTSTEKRYSSFKHNKHRETNDSSYPKKKKPEQNGRKQETRNSEQKKHTTRKAKSVSRRRKG